MTNLAQRIEALHPEQRRLLDERLRRNAAQKYDVRPLPRGEGQMSSPLSPGQMRIWETHQRVQQTPVNVVSQRVTIDGALDETKLRAAVTAVARRHEALRTTFAASDGIPVQTVQPEPTIELKVTHLDGNSADSGSALNRLALEQSWEPFDLARGPLARFHLVRHAADSHTLIVAAHNLIMDAWSFNVLIDELWSLHDAPSRDATALPAVPLQFIDFIDWQQRWQENPRSRRKLEQLQSTLSAPVAALPTDRPRSAERHYLGQRIEFDFAKEIKPRLSELGRRSGATLFMTLVALVQLWVRALSRDNNVAIGTLSANRGRTEFLGVLGYLLNVLPLRTDFSGDPDFAEVLRRTRQVVLDAQGDGEIPYETLIEQLGQTASHDRNPLFDVLFIYENVPRLQQSKSGLAIQTYDVDKGVSRYDLSIAIYDEAQALHGWVEYDSDLFDAATVERMRDDFVALVESVVARQPHGAV